MNSLLSLQLVPLLCELIKFTVSLKIKIEKESVGGEWRKGWRYKKARTQKAVIRSGAAQDFWIGLVVGNRLECPVRED